MVQKTQYGHTLAQLVKYVQMSNNRWPMGAYRMSQYLESLEGTGEDAWLSLGLCDQWSLMDFLNNYLVWCHGPKWENVLLNRTA